MTTTLINNGRSQAVRLPEELRLPGKKVSIRRLGDGVFIEPVIEQTWPDGFFEAIQIEDDAFVRPPQGATPPSPKLSS